MITNILCLLVGGVLGVITTSIAVVAGDADKCAECMRMREEIERERSNSKAE